MNLMREDMQMESNSRRSPKAKYSSSLFVPRASVIKHTKEFKPHSNGSVSKSLLFSISRTHCRDEYIHKHDEKKEEKDSGVDESFDDDEDKNISEESLGSGNYDSDQSMSGGSSEDAQTLSPISPLKFQESDENSKYVLEKAHTRFIDSGYTTDEQIDSVRPLLAKDPHLEYLLQLYRQADDKLPCTTNKPNRYNSSPYHDKKKYRTKEQIFEGKTNLRNPLVDFSIMTLQDSKFFAKNNLAPTPTMNNISLFRPGIFSYGFDTPPIPRDSNTNVAVDMKGLYFPDNRSTQIYNSSRKATQDTHENNLQCEYCHKKFNNEGAAKRHLLTHKGKRTHKCTQCSRSFYEQSSYLRHLKSHSGEKAHKCAQCSMAFSKRSALEVHIRTHTGERPFVCKYCGKGFSISGNLHRHVLIHTGHRPYKCGKCPRAFNNPSHLARHISSFHA